MGEEWVDLQFVVHSLETTIPSNEELPLDLLWNQYGGYYTGNYQTISPGQYRVVGEFVFGDGNVLTNNYEFTIVGSHAACNGNGQCVQTPGNGYDECSDDLNCTGDDFHTECEGQMCVQVFGGGTNECSIGTNCGCVYCGGG